jgi:hypothetical protein
LLLLRRERGSKSKMKIRKRIRIRSRSMSMMSSLQASTAGVGEILVRLVGPFDMPTRVLKPGAGGI